jgi:hypothetical protein
MFGRRKKPAEAMFGTVPSPPDDKAKRRNAHQSLFFGNKSKVDNNSNVFTNDDFELLRRKVRETEEHKEPTTPSTRELDQSLFKNKKKNKIQKLTELKASSPEYSSLTPNSPPSESALSNEKEIQDLKREIASMLENLDSYYDDSSSTSSAVSPSTPPSSSSSLKDLDAEHETVINKKSSFVVGVGGSIASVVLGGNSPHTNSAPPSPQARLRSTSVFASKLDRKLSDPNTLHTRKRGLGSMMGGFRKSIMMRRQSVFAGDSSPPSFDDHQYIHTIDSPRKSNNDVRAEEYRNLAANMIVEAEKKRLKELRQFSPQMILHGFYREGKLNETFFRMDVFYEKKESSLITIAKALNQL